MTALLKWMTCLCAALFVLSIAVSGLRGEGSPGDAVLGVWDDNFQGATIEVFKCGDLYCGKIVGLQNPEQDGKPVLDAKNPDPKLRSRPVMGVQVLTGFKYGGDNTWAGGTAYSPDRGKTYDATLTLAGNILSVRVKVGPVHKTVEWIRPEKTADSPKSGNE